ALDAIVLKQGVFNLIFHPHGWIKSEQIVDFIDYAVAKHGKKVKFLTFKGAQERLNKNLLAGNALRNAVGLDNGVRLIDLNNDGFLDVVISNTQTQKMRLWSPKERKWIEGEFPVPLVNDCAGERRVDAGVRFGVLEHDGFPSLLRRTEDE